MSTDSHSVHAHTHLECHFYLPAKRRSITKETEVPLATPGRLLLFCNMAPETMIQQMRGQPFSKHPQRPPAPPLA
ncbi:hypothetical protein PAL_GLEAN10002332 [Pteropus alecto]|uniref:Uncharacterized protein n=1 Tax=Pteropus alecto TaxID=9402 RepID=L5KET0_PTEAL|nr:hypothetical protein PAL_GLEAN10002332 [Pteropus alecto]